MNLIEIKNILNLDEEQVLKLPIMNADDLIGNSVINVTVENFINFLDSISLKATFKDELIFSPNYINATLEKFIENKETPLEYKHFLCNYVTPSLSEWFYLGEPGNRVYVHFFKNGHFLAFCTNSNQIKAYSSCPQITSTKEFHRIIASALTNKVNANIVELLNRQDPKILDNLDKFTLGNKVFSETELYSILINNQTNFKNIEGWFKVIGQRDNVDYISLVHGGSKLVLWFKVVEGLLCIFKVGVYDGNVDSFKLNEAENQMNEFLKQKESEKVNEVHIDFDKYDFSFGDKAIVLDLIEKLKEKVNNSETVELDKTYTDDIIKVASALIEEAQAIQSRVRFMENFKKERVERFGDVKSDRYEHRRSDRNDRFRNRDRGFPDLDSDDFYSRRRR